MNFILFVVAFLTCPLTWADTPNARPKGKTNRNTELVERLKRAEQIDNYIALGFGKKEDEKSDQYRLKSDDEKKLKKEQESIVSEFMQKAWEKIESHSAFSNILKNNYPSDAWIKNFLVNLKAKAYTDNVWNISAENKGMATYVSMLTNFNHSPNVFACQLDLPSGNRSNGLTIKDRPHYTSGSLSAEKTLAPLLASFEVMKSVDAPLELSSEAIFTTHLISMFGGARAKDFEAMKNHKAQILEVLQSFEKKINEAREEHLQYQYEDNLGVSGFPQHELEQKDNNFRLSLDNIFELRKCLNIADGTHSSSKLPVGQKESRDQAGDQSIDVQVSERICDNFAVLRKIYVTYLNAGLSSEAEKVKDLLKEVAVCTEAMDSDLRGKLENAINSYKRVATVFRPEDPASAVSPRTNKE